MKLERDMGRKFIYILTVLLFSLSINSFGYGIKKPFLWKGGTTKDGIVISEPKMDGFLVNGAKTGLTVVQEKQKTTMVFDVMVPNGKVAELEYKVLILLSSDEDEVTADTKLFFNTTLDNHSI